MITTLCRIDRKGRVRLPEGYRQALAGNAVYLTLDNQEVTVRGAVPSFAEEFSTVADEPPDGCDL